MRRCSKCDVILTEENAKKGRSRRCKPCHNQGNAAWRAKPGVKEYRREHDKKYRQTPAAKEYVKRRKKKYLTTEKGRLKNAEQTRHRHKRCRMAAPPWTDWRLIREIYRNCPAGWHVDHIMPLINPDVCGLHVPWNLQYLPAIENMKKGNKLPK